MRFLQPIHKQTFMLQSSTQHFMCPLYFPYAELWQPKQGTPVEYWPSSSTDGFAWKSLSFNSEEKNAPNLYASSSGRICMLADAYQAHLAACTRRLTDPHRPVRAGCACIMWQLQEFQ